MKMNSEQIARVLNQFEAEAIPVGHSAIAKLEPIYGDHTYFLDNNGLNIVEPVEAAAGDRQRGVVINLANWADGDAKSLETHAPVPTDLVVDLDSRH